MTDLVPKTTNTALSTDVQKLAEKANEYFDASLSENTRKAYASRWSAYQEWAMEKGLPFRPQEDTVGTVALFVTHLAEEGRKVSTIEQYLAAISLAHRGLGIDSPTRLEKIKRLVKGVRNTKGVAPDKKKAITVEQMRLLVANCPPTPKGKRDKVMLLIGFLGALRRSELVGICYEHVEPIPGGLKVLIPKSKTDQEGKGRYVTIPEGVDDICAVRSLVEWLRASGIKNGPLFRRTFRGGTVGENALTPRVVAMVIKEHAKAAGFDADDFAGHSLRSGYVTVAAQNGAADHEIMSQTGHKSVQTLHGYKQTTPRIENNPAKDFKL